MNKVLHIILIAVLLAACGPGRKLPEGAPARIKLKDLKEKALEAQNEYQSLRMRAMAQYSDESQSQNFRLEVRLLKDSLVWLDIADPILGIKVARALISKDSVVFINRIDKEYLSGNLEQFQKEFKLEFGFEELQQIFSANLLFDLQDDFELFYRPGLYLLSDFNPEGNSDSTLLMGKEKFRQVFISPENYKPTQQVQQEPAYGRRYKVLFNKLEQVDDGLFYPQEMLVEYLGEGRSRLEIEIRKVEKDEPGLNYPFNIPSGYAKMR